MLAAARMKRSAKAATTASGDAPVWQQGDESLYTDEAVAKRAAAVIAPEAVAKVQLALLSATRHHHQLCGLVSASQQWPLVRREAVSASLLSSPSLLLMAAVTRN